MREPNCLLMKNKISPLLLLRSLLVCFFCIHLSVSYGEAAAPRLARDYYSKDSGLLDTVMVEKMLAKNALEPDDVRLLSKLIENSTADRLRIFDKNIEGSRATGRGDSDSVELLVELKARLFEERTRIFSDLVRHIQAAELDDGRITLLISLAQGSSTKELTSLLPSIPQLLAHPDISTHGKNPSFGDAFPTGITLISYAADRGLLSVVDRSTPLYKAIVSELEKYIQQRKACGFNYENAAIPLIEMGSEEGQRLLQDAIAKATDTNASYSTLLHSAPESLLFLYVSPDVSKLNRVKYIGENVKRFSRMDISRYFFNNVKSLLMRFKKEGDMDSIAFITAYLQNEAKDQKNPKWAKMAEQTLQK